MPSDFDVTCGSGTEGCQKLIFESSYHAFSILYAVYKKKLQWIFIVIDISNGLVIRFSLLRIMMIIIIIMVQGGHGTGKTGNLVLTFSRQGKHREFCCNTGKVFETQGKYFWLYLLMQKACFSLHIFKFFHFKSLLYELILPDIFTVLCHILTSINQTYSGSFEKQIEIM